MTLLRGTIVPGTRLRAKQDVGTMRLLRALGPQLGSLYQELMDVDPRSLSAQQRAQREFLNEFFEAVSPDEKVYAT